MSELRECPCCKGEAVAENFIIEATVRCTACGLSIKRPHDAISDSGLTAAIASWNNRASPVQAEPIGAVHIDTLAMLPSLRTFDGAAKIWPASKAKFDTAYVPVYAHPPSGKDAEDAARYQVLRDPAYQMQEDDPCVTDDSFNTFFEDDLDKAVDALKARRDAAMSAAGKSDNSEMPNNLPAEGSRG